MTITINTQGSETTAILSGRLDTPSALEAGADFDSLAQKAAGTVILDCKDLNYISSSGLRLFLTVRKAAAAKGGKVIIRGIGSDIRNVFMMTGFLNLFTIEE